MFSSADQFVEIFLDLWFLLCVSIRYLLKWKQKLATLFLNTISSGAFIYCVPKRVQVTKLCNVHCDSLLSLKLFKFQQTGLTFGGNLNSPFLECSKFIRILWSKSFEWNWNDTRNVFPWTQERHVALWANSVSKSQYQACNVRSEMKPCNVKPVMSGL